MLRLLRGEYCWEGGGGGVVARILISKTIRVRSPYNIHPHFEEINS